MSWWLLHIWFFIYRLIFLLFVEIANLTNLFIFWRYWLFLLILLKPILLILIGRTELFDYWLLTNLVDCFQVQCAINWWDIFWRVLFLDIYRPIILPTKSIFTRCISRWIKSTSFLQSTWLTWSLIFYTLIALQNNTTWFQFFISLILYIWLCTQMFWSS